MSKGGNQASPTTFPSSLPSPPSPSATNLRQKKCSAHTFSIFSIGIPFVSGSKKYTNTAITNTHAAKKKKIPDFRRQSIARNACAIKNVIVRFTATTTLCAADLISSGKISLVTTHPSGPHESPNPDIKTHINTSTAAAHPLSIPPWSPSFAAIIPPTSSIDASICVPPKWNSGRRPTLSTSTTVMMVNVDATTPVTVAASSDAFSLAPINRGVEGDDVNPCNLLEKRDEDGHHQLGTVAPPHQVAEWVFYGFRGAAGGDEVGEFVVYVVCAADLAEDCTGPGRVVWVVLDEAVGGFREEEGADGEDGGGDAGHGDGYPPAPAAGYADGAVIDECCGVVADADADLEGDVEGASVSGRGHLR
ncbi:4-hydroxy-tetrahydrodipicolinate reductase [Striga asiatica]|uniref:4-hydroxy-tetrahydrodipicolinate reductase n=1 Tax=Striga asiatica TaxID=4170 RepID=A0A5A7R0A4_STRAF|nr:4-hydroxy-tetrahydrodipicolinate reductase [Striga asiatica]